MDYSYPRVVDFNKDGMVGLKDLRTFAQYWLEDESSAGIAPLPVGDGRVDFKDFAVLAEHWLKDFRLVVHWKLDETEGAIAHDNAGDNDGIVHGEPLWQPTGGKLDGMLELDGINDYISTSFVLDPAGGPFSVFAWVKGGAPGQVIISQTGGACWLATDPSQGNLGTTLKAPGRFGHQLWSQASVTDGDWHLTGLVQNDYRRALYVDGVEAANDIQAGLEGSDGGLYIGAVDSLKAGSFWSGLIDDVRIYSCGLSADEIADLYEDTFGALPE